MFKWIIQTILERSVRKYFAKHPDIKLVVVAGSVGKTSTKIAVGTVLSERFRVRLHEGNHNTQFSAPLAILGIDYPQKLRSISAWRLVLKAVKARINEPTDVDVIVQELGTDRIGEIEHFGKYLVPDIAVITAVSPEHMEFFGTIENVAKEELTVANYSKQALINRDDVDGVFSAYLTNASINTYGTSALAEYHFITNNYTIEGGHEGLFVFPESRHPIPANIHVLGEHTMRPAIAAGAIAAKFGMNANDIAKGLSKVRTLSGRMNVLRGVNHSMIIDDTYNSSPLAAKAALRELFQLSAPQKIVVLGDMNELGQSSQIEHEELGQMCDMSQLAWVVTVGSETEKYLAPKAREKGCQVRSFQSALDAGTFVHSVIEEGAIVLFKGSQGNVYLEEAIKIILHSTIEERQLVRQSPKWMETKKNFFQKDFK